MAEFVFDATNHLLVTSSGAGASTVNIQDTAGNPLTSTAGALNVNVSSPNPLPVSIVSGELSTVTVVQPTGTNLHTVTDTGSTTAVTGNVTVVQPTGTNLHVVVDSGSAFTVRSTANAANLADNQASTNFFTSATSVTDPLAVGDWVYGG